MGKLKYLSIIILLSAAVACRKTGVQSPEELPVVFSTEQTKAGLSSVFENFRVWASCVSEGVSTGVMEGYRVNYDVEQGWTYISGGGTEGQELKYWNASASEFRFHAGAPQDRVFGISESGLVLDMESTQTLSNTSLYSMPYPVLRTDPSFGNTVNLLFRYANARINLSFRYLSDAEVSITDISLTPSSPYAVSGHLAFGYDWERISVTPGALTDVMTSSDPLAFSGVVIPAQSGEAIATASPWYMVPSADAKGQWTLSLKVNGEVKQTAFTIDRAWEPGKSYVYRFEYTPDANLVFVGTTTELFVGEDLQDGGEHNFS